ncbi:hypothetical protein GF373_10905, partial [bacterium]|nr:hypothetical protein [bacterium]
MTYHKKQINPFNLKNKIKPILISLAFFMIAARLSYPLNNQVRFDFEDGGMQGWQVVEGAFDRTVCDWEFFHNQPQTKYNKQGTYYLNTLEKTDGTRSDSFIGTIESPVFHIQGATMSFLVGGGNHKSTYVALCDLQGREFLKARGDRAEKMKRVTWDASPFVGKKMLLRVVDKHKGGWGHVTFDDFLAVGRLDKEATQQRRAKLQSARREKERAKTHKRIKRILSSLEPAVAHLTRSFPQKYTRGKSYLTQIARYRRELSDVEWNRGQSMLNEIRDLQRKALLENPLLREYPILFVTRKQYLPDHHSTATLFQNGEINTASFRGQGNLKIFHPRTGEVETLMQSPHGIIRDPDIHFNATKALFSMRKTKKDDYHIYEMNLQNRAVRQLTTGANLSDIDPIYLPNNEILFVSTREPKYCQCNRHIMGNLFKMDAEGNYIRQIGFNTLFEGHPCLLPDGRILYDRWEYVDKHFGPAFGLWTVFPDGTNHAVYYGNNAWAPGAILDARPVPDSPLVVATLGSCHDRPWGAIALIDRRKGMDGAEPIVRSWPRDINHLITNKQDYGKGKQRHHPVGGQIDNFKRLAVKYEDPFPLSDTYFLCSRTIEQERTGLFLIDRFGNEICLYQEDELGCYDPMPIKPYPRPPVVPSRVDYAKDTGLFYIADVYKGESMKKVKRGTIHTLRVVEAPPKLFWTQGNWNLDATQAPAMNFNCTNNKRILGDVPVEPDGSVYFEVPADTFLFFQLLDGQGMM